MLYNSGITYNSGQSYNNSQESLLDIELQSTLTTTNTDTALTNLGDSYVTYINSISLTLQNGSSTNRTVTIYKNGSNSANEILNIDLNANNCKSILITDLRIKLTGTQSIYFKQDSGNDVELLLTCTREQIY